MPAIPEVSGSSTRFPEPFPADWAGEWGEDEHGLWMALIYRGVRQVFRWIAPGTLVPAPQGIGVVCNPGVLLLLEVQGEGRKRQEATEWLRGSRLPAGARFSASA